MLYYVVMLSNIAAVICIALIAFAAWLGMTMMLEIRNAHMCENLDGYEPFGATDAERYPPDTLAGICLKSMHDTSRVQVIILLLTFSAWWYPLTGLPYGRGRYEEKLREVEELRGRYEEKLREVEELREGVGRRG